MSNEPLKSVKTPAIVAHFINGRSVPDSGRTQDVFNPATGRAIRQVALAGKTTVESAIDAAEAAFPAWRDTPPIKRARIMFRFKELLEQHADEVVALITEEHGKVLHDARGEFLRGVENVEYACCAPELLKGEHNKNVGPAIDSWSEFQPLGVVAGRQIPEGLRNLNDRPGEPGPRPGGRRLPFLCGTALAARGEVQAPDRDRKRKRDRG